MNELKKTASKAFHVIILMITYEEVDRTYKAPTLHDALHEQMQKKQQKTNYHYKLMQVTSSNKFINYVQN